MDSVELRSMGAELTKEAGFFANSAGAVKGWVKGVAAKRTARKALARAEQASAEGFSGFKPSQGMAKRYAEGAARGERMRGRLIGDAAKPGKDFMSRMGKRYIKTRRSFMSDSRKKKPITGHGGGSEKRDKQQFNRSFRSQVKQCINKGRSEDLPRRPQPQSSIGSWDFAKDGKSYYTGCDRDTKNRIIRK